MKDDLNCDILVVGAGPAGSIAAKFAALESTQVILIDKRRTVGQPVQCAEYVPKLICREVSLDRRTIVQEIKSMITHLPDGSVREISSPGFMLDRNLFDLSLALDAIDAGAVLLSRTKAVSLEDGEVRVERRGEKFSIRAKVIIGADGPKSLVARAIGQANTQFISAFGYQVSLKHPCRSTHVFFDRRYAGGYGWLFPKGRTANIGVGVDTKLDVKPKGALAHLLARLWRDGFISEENILSSTGGLIPSDGYRPKTHCGNVLLVGDAAGQIDPITGAGIPSAVICGRIAGKVAGKAVRKGDLSLLEEYEKGWKEHFCPTLDRAIKRRKFLDENWYSGDFCGLIRKSWVAFKEYY